MKNNKYKYNIGDAVVIKAITTPRYDCIERVRYLEKTPITDKVIAGLICGMKRLYYGKIINDSFENMGYLSVEGSILVYEVRTGMLNKPLYVCEEDMERAFNGFKFPLLHQYCPYKWTEEDKYDLRIAVSTQPRDSKGRFIKA